MSRRFTQLTLALFAILALSALSFAYGRGGGGGGSHAGAYGHNNARPNEQRAQAEEQRAPEEPARSSNQVGNNAREDEPVRNVVRNPFVNPAEGNRVEANRYDAAYWNRAGYWGWGDWGPIGDWNTSSPPTNVQPAP